MVSELSPDGNKPDVIVDPVARLRRKYGEKFPAPEDWQDGSQWRLWVEGQRKRQEPIMRDKRLHWSRHRHFRAGHQWISTRDGRLWREPQADQNDVRPVLNLIGPALDFRLGLMMEQRPGFRLEPLGGGTATQEAAEAQQAVGEYYFHMLRAWNVFLDALFHSQTDGVCFIHVYIDPNAGPTTEDIEVVPPTDERFMGLEAQGYEVREDGNLVLPLSESGMPAPPDAEVNTLYGGDLACRIVTAHEVTFDPEARTVNGPTDRAKWAVIRRIRSVEEARIETGLAEIPSEMLITGQSDVLDMPTDRSMGWQRGLPPFPTRRQRISEGVPEYLIFITPDPNEPGLEAGVWYRVIGNQIVDQGDQLPGGVIPLARFTDGSPDTDIFPRPSVSDWIGDQVAINQQLAMIMKHARFFAGGRILAMKNTVLEETYSNIVGSVVEYQGQKPDQFPPVAAGSDAWKLLQFLIKKLEDKSQWSDLARGQPSGDSSMQDISGRAVLASRELFERAFGPSVRAAAEGATEWVQIIIRYAQWLFDKPRLIPIVGGRGDLAKMLSSEDLGERPLVYADPETMMPLPRALRAQMLKEELDAGRITLAQYQKRSPYADIRNLNYSDVDQWTRAQWVNTILEERWQDLIALPPLELWSPPNSMPIMWQDDTMAHKMALQEIILNDKKPWGLRFLASQRWGIYDQLGRVQADTLGMVPLPPEVLGVPLDRMPQPPLLPPAATTLPKPPGQGGDPTMTQTSAAPSISAVPSQAGQLKTQPLGPTERFDAQQA